MCDETDLSEFTRNARGSGLSRRQFAAAGAMASIAACTPTDQSEASPGSLVETMVSIPMADGTMEAFFVHPSGSEHAAVIVWPDIAGLRDSFMMMARRLAQSGYAVLVANPYYRDVSALQFTDFADFLDGGRDKVTPWREKLSADAIMRDAKSLVAWLDVQDAVDTGRGIGTQGYCMGGPFTIWSATAVPGRIKAAGSFHGGGLVRDDAQSPHRLMVDTPACYLIAIAQNDDEKDPESTATLKDIAESGAADAEVEVYPANHGWCVYDSPSYAEGAAERAWSRLLALYDKAL
jgi:carboxymethylenebutenolidase